MSNSTSIEDYINNTLTQDGSYSGPVELVSMCLASPVNINVILFDADEDGGYRFYNIQNYSSLLGRYHRQDSLVSLRRHLDDVQGRRDIYILYHEIGRPLQHSDNPNHYLFLSPVIPTAQGNNLNATETGNDNNGKRDRAQRSFEGQGHYNNGQPEKKGSTPKGSDKREFPKSK